MRVTQKIYLLLGLSLLVAAAMTVYLLYRMDGVRTDYDTILQTTVHQAEEARVMQVTFKKQVQAWKDILLRGSNPPDLEKYTKDFLTQEGSVDKIGEGLEKEVKSPETKEKIRQFLEAHHTLGEKYRAGLEAFKQSNGHKTFEVDKMLKGQDRPPTDLIDGIVGDLQKSLEQEQAGEKETLVRQAKLLTTAAIILFGALLGVSWILGRAIHKRFEENIGLLQDLAEGEGDLTARLPENTNDEFGESGRAINHFVKKLQDMIVEVRDDVTRLASASQEFSSVSQQVAANSEETSAQVEVVSESTEQVSGSLQTLSTAAEKMNATIHEVSKNAGEAARVAGEAVETAKKVNVRVAELGDASNEINGILKVITAIAQKTDLLALNATIEAERAGAAGKGFGVVANEVKELSERTAKATDEIGKKIGVIQTELKDAVEAIAGVGTIIQKISGFSVAIASAVEEQSDTSNQVSVHVGEAAKATGTISQNISGVADAARSTAQAASDSQKAVLELAELSTQLRGFVEQFKVEAGGNGNQPRA